MLNKMIFLMKNLYVYPENMLINLNKTKGLIFSQEVLLALIKKGITREDAYQIVQKNAMKSWNKGIDFKKLLYKDSNVNKYLTNRDIDALFDLDKIMVNINKIYKRIGLD